MEIEGECHVPPAVELLHVAQVLVLGVGQLVAAGQVRARDEGVQVAPGALADDLPELLHTGRDACLCAELLVDRGGEPPVLAGGGRG